MNSYRTQIQCISLLLDISSKMLKNILHWSLFSLLFICPKLNILEHKSITYNKEHSNNSLNGVQHFNNYTYKTYNNQIICTPSSRVEYPNSISEVQAIVFRAIKSKQTVKPIGNLFSTNDIICTEGIPIRMTNFNYTRINDDGSVIVGAGCRLRDVLFKLHLQNKTLILVPSYGGITIGGALGTGAHGSSLLHSTSLSDQLLKLTIMDGLGKIHRLSDPEELKAFRVHLGLLGIVIDVTLSTVPLFKMNISNTYHSDEILSDGTAINYAKKADFFSMWWFPSTESVVVANGNYLKDTSVPGDASTFLIPHQEIIGISFISWAIEVMQRIRSFAGFSAFQWFTQKSLYQRVVGRPPIYSEDGVQLKNPAVGFGWKLLQNDCSDKCPWSYGDNSVFPEDFSISVEINEFPRAVETIKLILKDKYPYFYLIGIFLRFSKHSDAFMSTSSGQNVVSFEWIAASTSNTFEDPKYGLAAYQAIQQALISQHGGRPHWGKNGLHYSSRLVMKQTVPNKKQFLRAMRKYDPNGVFLNKFGLRLLGVSSEMNIHPEATRCALQDLCVCHEDSDCADFQVCQEVHGYQVCADLPGFYESYLLSAFKMVVGFFNP